MRILTITCIVVWYIGYVYVGVRYWDTWNFGTFLETLIRAFLWPIWLMGKGVEKGVRLCK